MSVCVFVNAFVSECVRVREREYRMTVIVYMLQSMCKTRQCVECLKM